MDTVIYQATKEINVYEHPFEDSKISHRFRRNEIIVVDEIFDNWIYTAYGWIMNKNLKTEVVGIPFK